MHNLPMTVLTLAAGLTLMLPVGGMATAQGAGGADALTVPPRSADVCLAKVQTGPGGERGESVIRVPGVRKGALERDGYRAAPCPPDIVTSGLTICQLHARGEPGFRERFERAHNVDLAVLCAARAAGQAGAMPPPALIPAQ